LWSARGSPPNHSQGLRRKSDWHSSAGGLILGYYLSAGSKNSSDLLK
jgi:hypothetical protein